MINFSYLLKNDEILSLMFNLTAQQDQYCQYTCLHRVNPWNISGA